jgi:hypothetical protein
MQNILNHICDYHSKIPDQLGEQCITYKINIDVRLPRLSRLETTIAGQCVIGPFLSIRLADSAGFFFCAMKSRCDLHLPVEAYNPRKIILSSLSGYHHNG